MFCYFQIINSKNYFCSLFFLKWALSNIIISFCKIKIENKWILNYNESVFLLFLCVITFIYSLVCCENLSCHSVEKNNRKHEDIFPEIKKSCYPQAFDPLKYLPLNWSLHNSSLLHNSSMRGIIRKLISKIVNDTNRRGYHIKSIKFSKALDAAGKNTLEIHLIMVLSS